MNMPLNTSANINDTVAQARYNMIEQQIRPWNVLDADVLDLLTQVHREDFVPPAYKSMAFMDMAIPLLGQPEQDLRLGQCMLAPRIEARMLQDLHMQPTDRVLEIGTGSGYMAALLAKKAQHVVTLEINPAIADIARDNLQNAGIYNVDVRVQDASKTLPNGPFDVIVLSGSIASAPQNLITMLSEGGRLAAIVGQEPIMRFTLVRPSAQGAQTTTPWDTTAPRLLHFPEPSRFTF